MPSSADGSLRTKASDADPPRITAYDYDAFGKLRNVKLPDDGPVEYLIVAQNRAWVSSACRKPTLAAPRSGVETKQLHFLNT